MKWFFKSRNAFNCVFFLSVFIFAIVKTFIFKENLYEISLVLGVLTLFLSIFSLVVSVLDSVIDYENKEIFDLSEQYPYIDFDYYLNFSNEQLAKDFEINSFTDEEKYEIIRYRSLLNVLRPQIKVRRFFLFFHYLTITVIMAYLFLETELSKYLSSIEIQDFALLSFVIILFEVLLKNSVSDALLDHQGIKVMNAISNDFKIIERLENENNGQA